MKTNFLKVLTLCCATAVGALTSAHAADGVKVGVLTCGVEGGAGYVIGSTRELRCVFTQDGDRNDGERYVGVIRKYGLDIGVTDKTELTWVVFAPTNRVHAGALGGNYIGTVVDASVGVGGGANVLVGGSDRTISLQPLSLQGQTGLNAAVTVASIDLEPVEHHHHRRHN